jgi:hypothetical protein
MGSLPAQATPLEIANARRKVTRKSTINIEAPVPGSVITEIRIA